MRYDISLNEERRVLSIPREGTSTAKIIVRIRRKYVYIRIVSKVLIRRSIRVVPYTDCEFYSKVVYLYDVKRRRRFNRFYLAMSRDERTTTLLMLFRQ